MPAPVSTESAYHSSVLETLCATGACNTQQLDRFHQLLRTLTGECASDAPEVNGVVVAWWLGFLRWSDVTC